VDPQPRGAPGAALEKVKQLEFGLQKKLDAAISRDLVVVRRSAGRLPPVDRRVLSLSLEEMNLLRAQG